MNKITRPEEPKFLAEKAPKWNANYVKNKAKGAKFEWYQYKKEAVNKLLMPILEGMTQKHCAFCDGDNFATSLKTIEHFRPKDKFPHLAYTWTNLFLCCNACQNAKGEKFENTLLKPDEADYQFSTYFQCNFKTGELEPNAATTDIQKGQALRHYSFV